MLGCEHNTIIVFEFGTRLGLPLFGIFFLYSIFHILAIWPFLLPEGSYQRCPDKTINGPIIILKRNPQQRTPIHALASALEISIYFGIKSNMLIGLTR